MEAICASCPVSKACALAGIDGSNGGFYAGIWLPWPSEYRARKDERSRALTRLRKFIMSETIAAVR